MLTRDRIIQLLQIDTRTQDAVIRNLEILGEASKKLSQEFRAAHEEVPWNSMAGIPEQQPRGFTDITQGYAELNELTENGTVDEILALRSKYADAELHREIYRRGDQ